MAYIGKSPAVAALTASDITDGIISNAKLAQDIMSAETALAVAPAATDEFLLSDAGTLKRIDYSLIKPTNTPAFYATLSGNQTLGDGTNTKIAFDTAAINVGSGFDTTNNRFVVPTGEDGKYVFYGQVNSDSGDILYIETTIALNGTEVNYTIMNPDDSHSNLPTHISAILDIDATDYVELFVTSNQTSGSATITASVRGTNTLFYGYKLIE